MEHVYNITSFVSIKDVFRARTRRDAVDPIQLTWGHCTCDQSLGKVLLLYRYLQVPPHIGIPNDPAKVHDLAEFNRCLRTSLGLHGKARVVGKVTTLLLLARMR